MSFQNRPDFDAQWDFANPEQTEARFREIILQFPEDDPALLELLTQIARAQGLQRKFEQALEMAKELQEDFYAVDALHMLAIVRPDDSIVLNRQAIELAGSSGEERARNWLGSLSNNLGWSYHDRGDYTSALETFEKAETWGQANGQVNETRVASWCVARTLRSLGRVEEALTRQILLKDELEVAGEPDGYVYEEIGECLPALNREEEARPYLLKAHDLLRQDPWLVETEPERLARLKELGGI
jgi:tetratricopeptide (TPR) repeat protein